MFLEKETPMVRVMDEIGGDLVRRTPPGARPVRLRAERDKLSERILASRRGQIGGEETFVFRVCWTLFDMSEGMCDASVTRTHR